MFICGTIHIWDVSLRMNFTLELGRQDAAQNQGGNPKVTSNLQAWPVRENLGQLSGFCAKVKEKDRAEFVQVSL